MKLPVELAPGVWRLGTYNIAVFLIGGSDAAALFEVGVSGTSSLVLSQIDALGISRESIRWVVASHGHADHATGQAALMAGLPNASLVLTPTSAKFMAKPSTADDWAAEDAFTNQALHQAGEISPPASQAALDLLPEPMHLVEPGDQLDLGDMTLDFMSADGHVPGGLTAHIPQRRAVLSSDSGGFVSQEPPGFPLYFVSYQTYLDTMQSLADLKPEILAPGHQDYFMGSAVSQYLTMVKDDLARDHQAIGAEAKRGCTPQAIAQQLFEHYYQNELLIYSPGSIMECCELLVRRSLEEEGER